MTIIATKKGHNERKKIAVWLQQDMKREVVIFYKPLNIYDFKNTPHHVQVGVIVQIMH